jgi:hypothetical protein
MVVLHIIADGKFIYALPFSCWSQLYPTNKLIHECLSYISLYFLPLTPHLKFGFDARGFRAETNLTRLQ